MAVNVLSYSFASILFVRFHTQEIMRRKWACSSYSELQNNNFISCYERFKFCISY